MNFYDNLHAIRSVILLLSRSNSRKIDLLKRNNSKWDSLRTANCTFFANVSQKRLRPSRHLKMSNLLLPLCPDVFLCQTSLQQGSFFSFRKLLLEEKKEVVTPIIVSCWKMIPLAIYFLLGYHPKE